MLNPNHVSKMYGEVISLSRSPDGSLNISVRMISGHILNELGFIRHKTLAVGDQVTCEIGYSITSDRYGIKGIRKTRKDYRGPRITNRFVEMVVDQAYRNGMRCHYNEFRGCFVINGAYVLPKNALKATQGGAQ